MSVVGQRRSPGRVLPLQWACLPCGHGAAVRVTTELPEGRAAGGAVSVVGHADLSAPELAPLESSDQFLSSSDTDGPNSGGRRSSPFLVETQEDNRRE
jgi:hypothetical protein